LLQQFGYYNFKVDQRYNYPMDRIDFKVKLPKRKDGFIFNTLKELEIELKELKIKNLLLRNV
jgi:hypothetical protein